ncbi:MAG: hypothetical protein KJI70_00040 [Patescibacteria group bacterium]|nr:hypothetical protein [Patescibacteria group bacterium]
MSYLILGAGFLGGAVRGLTGFIKHQFAYKNVSFKLGYFLGTVVISGMIGFASAYAVQNVGFSLEGAFSPALSFIVGYAGGDFIENIYKILIKKSSLYSEK